MSELESARRNERAGGAGIGVLVLIAAVLIAASVVRILPAFGDFWLDEIWTYHSVRNLDAATGVFNRIHHSNNNHLNSLFLYWIGDRSDWFAYRIPSLVAGIGTVALATALAWRRTRLEAVFAALLTGACFALIHFSSEARGYSLGVFFALAATYSLERDLARPRWWRQWLFGACSILGFLSHLVFLFYYVGAVAQSAWRLLRRTNDRRGATLHLARLHALPVAAFLWLYAVDLRHLQVGGGNPTDFSELFSKTVGYTLGLPAVSELALPYLLLAGAIGLAGLRLAWREGDDSWILMAIAIFAAPLIVLGLMRPRVVAVRYFLIGIALLLLLASRLLAALYEAGGWRRGLCLTAIAVFLIGNAAHTVPFLERGRGGYLDALLFMARHSDGPRITAGSDHDFRNEIVLRFYKRHLPDGKVLVYYPRGSSPPGGTEWLIAHRPRRPEHPPPRIHDGAGNRYELAAEFDHAAISGFYWALYRNASAGGRPAESPTSSAPRRRMTVPKPRP
jgi:hypothetical protein